MQNVQSTKDVISIFIRDRKSQNLSKHTILFYESRLRIFLKSPFCSSEISNITSGDIKLFLWNFAESHAASTTFSMYNVLRIFFNWFSNELDIPNPIAKVKPPRVPKKILDPVSLDDINKMLQHCNTRWQSIILFLLDSGCRSSEFLALDVDSVNMLSGVVYIKRGKGGKSRTTFISPPTRKVLKKYLRERKVQSEALWTTTVGNRLSYSALNASLKRISQKAGVPPVNPHGLRRSAASNMMLSGMSLESIRVILGHSSISSVLSLYLKQTDDDLMLAHRQHSPVERLNNRT